MIKNLLLAACIFLSACASSPNKNDLSYPPTVDATEAPMYSTPPKIENATVGKIREELNFAYNKSEWTEKEKWAFWLSTIAHLADLGTSLASDERCIERNPILGTNPSDGALISVKVLAIGFEYWLYNSRRFHNSQSTHWYGFASALIHGRTAYTNSQNDCYD